MTASQKTFDQIAFVASDVPEARSALEQLTTLYGNARPADADAIMTYVRAFARK